MCQILSYVMFGIFEDEEMLHFEAEADTDGVRHLGRRRGRVYRERVFDVECLDSDENLDIEEESERLHRSSLKRANKNFSQKLQEVPRQATDNVPKCIMQMGWRASHSCDLCEGFECRYLIITMSSAQTRIFTVNRIHNRPLKKDEVLIFGAALNFSHYFVHLMPIGTTFSEIDQYLDLPHRL